MKKSLLLGFIFLIASTCFAVPRSSQELIPAGSEIYNDIDYIFTESGKTSFADCAPMSIMELKSLLLQIDYSSLSVNAKSKYDKIFAYFNDNILSFDSDLLSIGVEPIVNMAGFFKDNDNIDWVYDRYSRKPFFYAPVTISGGDYFTMSADMLLAQNKNSALKNDNYMTIPLSADDIDINFPETAYFSCGKMLTEKSGVNFQLGRGLRNIGNSLTGSMIWSEYLTGVSYAQLEAFSPNFRYTTHISQFNVDKYMYFHQLDARFFDKFQFSAMEGCLVYAPMELRFMNPWTIFHGMSPWRDYEADSYDSETNVCAYLGIKFQFTPIKNLKFYGNYAQTQFQTTYETSNYPDDCTPNGLGGQLGTVLNIPLEDAALSFALEGSYADPYLYIKEDPNWTLVRTYCENSGSKRHPFYEWIGSPFGPDTISTEAKITYEVPNKFDIGLTYLFMAKGENAGENVFKKMETKDGRYAWGGNKTSGDKEDGYVDKDGNESKTHIMWCYPDKDRDGIDEAKRKQNLVTPSGTPEYVNRISVRMRYYFKQYLSVTVQPSYVVIFNNNHKSGNTQKGIEFAAAFEIKLLKL